MRTEDFELHGQRLAALAEKIIHAADGQSHRLLLDALITVYVAVAEHHSCCTRAAAMVCKDVAHRLENGKPDLPQAVFLH
jgi:hypothetical protein